MILKLRRHPINLGGRLAHANLSLLARKLNASELLAENVSTEIETKGINSCAIHAEAHAQSSSYEGGVYTPTIQ